MKGSTWGVPPGQMGRVPQASIAASAPYREVTPASCARWGPLRAAVVASRCLWDQGRCRGHHLSLLLESKYYGPPHPFGNFSRVQAISPCPSNHF